MRARLATVVACAVSAAAGAGVALWVTHEGPARIELKVESKRMLPGQTFDVEVVPPESEQVCFDGAYLLSIRRDDRWIATNELAAADRGEAPFVGPARDPRLGLLSGCESRRTKHRLRVPPGARPGRYRLKKYFDLGNRAARELIDAGYEVNPDCCLEAQWWVDFDVVPPPGP